MAARWHETGAHGLPHDPLKAIVAPRPIGWISTWGPDGTANLAPYSFFNLVSDRPPLVMFASTGAGEGRWKDSAANAVRRGAFAANLATFDAREAVSGSSAPLPPGASEFDAVGLAPAPCRAVDAPMIAGHGAVLECALTQHLIPRTRAGGEADAVMVLGEVVGVWLDEAWLREGRFDAVAAGSLARLGYRDYARVERTFEMARPSGVGKG